MRQFLKRQLSLPVDKVTYMVSAEWFNKLKLYIEYDTEMGEEAWTKGDHPGPINNLDLL